MQGMTILKTTNPPNKPPALGFRPDVEGMRGVAVLLVLSYHCTFSLFQGGYVGVDVFFVISGYLITRLLLDALENDAFSARDFYVRRVRRLIPSLLVTTALTLLAGLVILSPRHLKELSISSIFATLSLSNVYFASSGGYFATSAKIKPLLHTWSLGVEEQFYLLWPLSLWFAFQIRLLRQNLFPLIGVLALCGVLLSEYWIGRNPTQAYFLLPFRVHQLLIGALALGVERRVPALNQIWATVVFFTGAAILLISAAMFGESTPFPGFASVAPAAGGFLMIVGGAHAPLARRILGATSLAWIGRLSYSIYLAHWPIIAYAHYLSIEPFDIAEKWSFFAASIAAGALLHYGVEAKYRLAGAPHRWSEARGVVFACVALVAISVAPIPLQGLPQRMDLVPEKRDFGKAMQFQFLRDYRDGVLHEGSGTSGKTVLLFGDSMMQNYVPALLSLREIRSADVTIITRGGCVAGWGSLHVVNGSVDEDCRSLRDKIFRDASHYDLVIWAQSWLEYEGALYVESDAGVVPAKGDSVSRWSKTIAETLARLEPRSGKVVVVGPQLTVAGVPPALERIGPVTNMERIPAALTRMTEIRGAERDRFAEQLRSIASKSQVLDPKAIVCPDGVCRFHDLQLSYFLDPIHFTAAMTPIVAPLIGNELAPALR